MLDCPSVSDITDTFTTPGILTTMASLQESREPTGDFTAPCQELGAQGSVSASKTDIKEEEVGATPPAEEDRALKRKADEQEAGKAGKAGRFQELKATVEKINKREERFQTGGGISFPQVSALYRFPFDLYSFL